MINWQQRARDCWKDSGLAGCITSLELLPGGGGSRRQIRLKLESADFASLLLVSHGNEMQEQAEEAFFVRMAEVLEGFGPLVITQNSQQSCYLVEDLGNRRLLELVRDGAIEAGKGLMQVLARLAEIQQRLVSHFPAEEALHPPMTGSEFRRLESAYYQQRFLLGHLGLQPDPKLDDELETFALSLDSLPAMQGVLLRDVQSTNVLLDQAGRWRFIDFQGARVGPWAYDMMSLLFDPYLKLDPTESWAILHKAAGEFDWPAPAAALLQAAPAVGLHRMLQALGAYGKLGGEEGKSWFLDHIPQALENARFLLGKLGSSLPELERVLADPGLPPARG
jgi:aminoglycoside/choline kinase family phosphotransferase